ncbi:MAG: outer membrane lipoprotein carrier protein LolA [Spirochaetes bacterium]|nr:outer membrane lipoprotein carrier protein LolA [Spirochaetota bacterium]
MKNYAIILLLNTFCFFPLSIYADDWGEIAKVAKNIKSVSAGFIQEKHMRILVKPLISEGRFLFTAPGSLRWEYISPVKSILISHNGRIKSYIEGKDGLVEDTRSKSAAIEIVMQQITSWLNGRFHEDSNFKAVLVKDKTDKIILSPKDKSLAGIISSIELSISRAEAVIKSVKISESSDSYTLIKFTEIKHNKDIDEREYKEIK